MLGDASSLFYLNRCQQKKGGQQQSVFHPVGMAIDHVRTIIAGLFNGLAAGLIRHRICKRQFELFEVTVPPED